MSTFFSTLLALCCLYGSVFGLDALQQQRLAAMLNVRTLSVHGAGVRAVNGQYRCQQTELVRVSFPLVIENGEASILSFAEPFLPNERDSTLSSSSLEENSSDSNPSTATYSHAPSHTHTTPLILGDEPEPLTPADEPRTPPSDEPHTPPSGEQPALSTESHTPPTHELGPTSRDARAREDVGVFYSRMQVNESEPEVVLFVGFSQCYIAINFTAIYVSDPSLSPSLKEREVLGNFSEICGVWKIAPEFHTPLPPLIRGNHTLKVTSTSPRANGVYSELTDFHLLVYEKELEIIAYRTDASGFLVDALAKLGLQTPISMLIFFEPENPMGEQFVIVHYSKGELSKDGVPPLEGWKVVPSQAPVPQFEIFPNINNYLKA